MLFLYGGSSMAGDDAHDAEKLKAARRDFLLQCGRFAVVTPPVVTLMLAVSDKASAKHLAASGITTETTTTQTTTTQTTTTQATTSATTTATQTTTTEGTTTATTTVTTFPTTQTEITSVITTTTTTVSITRESITTVTTTTQGMLLEFDPSPRSAENSALAMVIDSLGLMRII
jgi:hypothetical protein